MRELSLKGRFGRDVLWNIGSLGVVGIAGVGLNFLIGALRGAEAIGVFNQALAIFIVLSQFAVGGMYCSVLKHVADHAGDRGKLAAIISSALFIAVLSAGLVAVIVYFSRNLVAQALQSPDMARATALIAPGLVFFALNKVLIGSLNGMRVMRGVAIFQSSRVALYFLGVFMLIRAGADNAVLPAALSIGEAVLFFPAFVSALYYSLHGNFLRPAAWFKTHLTFAKKSFFIGLFLDTATRVDVLILGYFMRDADVGVYSIAALLAEGLGQIAFAAQINITPLWNKNDAMDIDFVVKKAMRTLLPFMLLCAAAGGALYAPIVQWMTRDASLAGGSAYFLILATCYSLASPWTAAMSVLNQRGRPGAYALLLGGILGTNIFMNLLLIPQFGSLGAAIATGISVLCIAPYLRIINR